MQITARLDTDPVFSLNLKLISEELWLCDRDVITLYDCQWNKLREIRLGRWATSVAALDTKTVVIATNRGLVISSTSGTSVNVRCSEPLIAYMKSRALLIFETRFIRMSIYGQTGLKNCCARGKNIS